MNLHVNSAPSGGEELRTGGQLEGFLWAINRIAKLSGYSVDQLRLHEAALNQREQFKSLDYVSLGVVDQQPPSTVIWQDILNAVLHQADMGEVEFFQSIDPVQLPLLAWTSEQGWVVITNLNAQNQWMIESGGQLSWIARGPDIVCARLIVNSDPRVLSHKTARELIRTEFFKHKKVLIEAGLAGLVVNLLTVLISLYSMQIYDRVIPNQGYATLAVLTLGAFIALIFDAALKFARSHLINDAYREMDDSISRYIFARFLSVRLDQLPHSVGTLSAQLRGYESVRAFLSSATFYLFIDAPFGIIFIIIIIAIGSPIVALTPILFLMVVFAFGFAVREKIDAHAVSATNSGNIRTGLLVEAIEGAETIKSSGGAWGVLRKWIDVNREAMIHEVALRSLGEKSGHITSLMQQGSYIGMVAIGAYVAGENVITSGALIACTILSGRAMAPIAQIPGIIIQAAQAKASLKGLEAIFSLESDNHSVARPIILEKIQGSYKLKDVRYGHRGSPKALLIPALSINAGERLGIIGAVGAGKSTLLRLLTGMYRASEGVVKLDDLDISQISNRLLSERIGYLQQEHRLFGGTLRENLLIGIVDPGDDVIKAVAAQTGLLELISGHPQGLSLPVSEGGMGLSGGQKQLVAFTRLLLGRPSIWILDEPTASMDANAERLCITALLSTIKRDDTLILVTHKPQLLQLINRLILISDQKIVIDGDRDQVLRQLNSGGPQHSPSASL